MTSALTATRPQVTGGPSGLRYAHPTRRGAVVGLAQQSYSDRIVRLVTAAPIVAAAGMVVVQLALTWSITASLPTTGIAAALVACYLPFHLHHVWAAAHARRPHSGDWTLAAMAVIIAAGTPLVGYAWLTTWVQLLVSVLIVLSRPWSVLAGGVLVAALGPLNILLGNENSPIWLVLVLLERTCAVLVPAWLSGALRQLRAARADLAAHAVLQERIHIDGELADTVGQSLADIAARGISTGDLAGRAAPPPSVRCVRWSTAPVARSPPPAGSSPPTNGFPYAPSSTRRPPC